MKTLKEFIETKAVKAHEELALAQKNFSKWAKAYSNICDNEMKVTPTIMNQYQDWKARIGC